MVAGGSGDLRDRDGIDGALWRRPHQRPTALDLGGTSSGRSATQRWELFHHYIRKCGHFVGYGTMGLLWLRALWMSLPRSGFLLGCALLRCLGPRWSPAPTSSISRFLPNRTGVPSDVLLDCCGAVVLLLLTYLSYAARSPSACPGRPDKSSPSALAFAELTGNSRS